MSTAAEHPQGDNPLNSGRTTRSFDWTYFVERSGEEGQAWLREYRRPDLREIVRLANEALLLLRQRQLKTGRAMLDDVEARLGALTGCMPSILEVMDRWHQGILAFYHYRVDDFESAENSVLRAQGSLISAMGRCRFLLPLANHCHEFRLHRARIERNQRHWESMWGHIEATRAMMDDREPLCVLADGTEVRFATLVEFYAALLPIGEEASAFLIAELDLRLRMRLFDNFVLALCTIPGFVIPYP